VQARLRSYLSDNGVRLEQHTKLTEVGEVEEQIRQARLWSERQWSVIDILLQEIRHADQQRRHWRRLIAQEVLADPQLLALVRLCGVREMVAFALGAFVGNIQRFDHPKKLVKYVGLNPALMRAATTSGPAALAVTATNTCVVCWSKGLRLSCAAPARRWRCGARGSWPEGADQPGGCCHGAQADGRRLVPDDGPLDAAGRDR